MPLTQFFSKEADASAISLIDCKQYQHNSFQYIKCQKRIQDTIIQIQAVQDAIRTGLLQLFYAHIKYVIYTC